MNAIFHLRYGESETLSLGDVARPIPADDEVLVKIQFAAVNKGDWHILTGKPYLVRVAGYGLCNPKHKGFGQEFSGRVVGLGANVSTVALADDVFGEIASGAFAEFAVVKATEVAEVPEGVTLEQAASIPSSALTALQGLRDHGQLKTGDKVLINGASGGVGTFAVQLAKFLGAEVTGVCSTDNVALVASLGADQVIDYTKTDFTAGTMQYDLIFDLVGNRSLSDLRRILAPAGTHVACAGEGGDWFGPMGRMMQMGLIMALGRGRMVSYITKPNAVDLTFVAELVAAGRVRPVIGRRCELVEVPEAVQYQGSGRVRGKTIVAIA